MILQPLGTRVLVRRSVLGKIGSLFVPKGSQEMKFNLGEVFAVGPDCTAVAAGDMVTFGRYAPVNMDRTELESAGLDPIPQDEEWLLMNEEDVLCIILKDEPVVIVHDIAKLTDSDLEYLKEVAHA